MEAPDGAISIASVHEQQVPQRQGPGVAVQYGMIPYCQGIVQGHFIIHGAIRLGGLGDFRIVLGAVLAHRHHLGRNGPHISDVGSVIRLSINRFVGCVHTGGATGYAGNLLAAAADAAGGKTGSIGDCEPASV